MQKPNFYAFSPWELLDWVETHDVLEGKSICGTDFTYIEEILEDENEDGPCEGVAFDELLEFANIIWEERYAC